MTFTDYSPRKLVSNDTFKDGAENGVFMSSLQKATDVQVNVVHVPVDFLQLLDVPGLHGLSSINKRLLEYN